MCAQDGESSFKKEKNNCNLMKISFCFKQKSHLIELLPFNEKTLFSTYIG